MTGSSNLDGTASRLVLFSTKVLGHPFSITVFEDKGRYSLKIIYDQGFNLLYCRCLIDNFVSDFLLFLYHESVKQSFKTGFRV